MSPARGPVQTPKQSRQAEARAAATNSQRQRLPPALIKSPLTSSAPSPGAWLDSEPVITADKELSEWSCGPQPPPCTGAQPGDTPGQGAPRSRRHPSLWRQAGSPQPSMTQVLRGSGHSGSRGPVGGEEAGSAPTAQLGLGDIKKAGRGENPKERCWAGWETAGSGLRPQAERGFGQESKAVGQGCCSPLDFPLHPPLPGLAGSGRDAGGC